MMHLGFSKSIRVYRYLLVLLSQKGGQRDKERKGDPPCTPARSQLEARVFRRLTVLGEEDKFLQLVELA